MIVIIDNYDSFVYNLAQYVGELGFEPAVYRNDEISLSEIERLAPSHIIISPGPCTPLEAAISNETVRYFGGKIPLLGVCLGHQCIGHVYGGRVVHAPLPVHGKSSLIYHDSKRVYRNLPCPFPGARYHSLAVDLSENSPELEVTARTAEGVIMGVRHRLFVIEGVQFHPESIMTEVGHEILSNFLKYRQAVWPEE
jgi:anthranilate synthase/aminodeoxychorismate synthase-like glutamine amidotransferase